MLIVVASVANMPYIAVYDIGAFVPECSVSLGRFVVCNLPRFRTGVDWKAAPKRGFPFGGFGPCKRVSLVCVVVVVMVVALGGDIHLQRVQHRSVCK